MVTFVQLEGVGVNVQYEIWRNGQEVAHLRRTGQRSTFGIYSVHYREKLGHYPNIERAKEAALEIEYPDARSVYETVCQRTEKERRFWKQREMVHEFAALARDLASGSNSAQEALINLSNAVEAYAKDRSDTDRSSREDADGQWVHRSSSEPIYPEPPE